jgi:hypothetical protein
MRAAFVLLIGLGISACGSTRRPLALGESCTPGDSVVVCGSGLCVSLDSQTGFCAAECTDTCPEGFECQGAGRYGKICRALTGCKTEVDCPSGHVCDSETGNCHIAVSRQLCAPCQDVAQCPMGGSCFLTIGSGEQFCTSPCGAGDSCPTGFACREIPVKKDGTLSKQCTPANETCNAGRGLCAACKGDNECGGPFDLCVRNVVSGETFCSKDCNPRKNICKSLDCDPLTLDAAENPDCPKGFACANIGKSDDPNAPQIHQCVPNSNSCVGYCNSETQVGQSSTECGTGKVCKNNTCSSAVDGRMCSPCNTNDDCRRNGFSENSCLINNCPDCPFKGESFCSTPCADDAACTRSFGSGFVCKTTADPTGIVRKYCMPQRGTCKSGLKKLGEDCSTKGAQDCVAGVCLTAGLSTFCSGTCTTDSECGDSRFRCCEVSGTSYDCGDAKRSPTGPLSGIGVCAPLGGLFGDDCSPGRSPCQTGTCLDLGTARVCTVLCNNQMCPSGFSCRKATAQGATGDLDVCFPNGGGKVGADCSFGPAACETGLCIRKGTGSQCTAPCTVVTDCPAQWACETLKTVTDMPVQACLPPTLQEG